MAKNIQSLQLLRNGTLFGSKQAAKNALIGFTTTNQPSADMDGVAVLARYSGESATDVKTLVGFYYSGANATTVTIFDSEALADAESKINRIISGVGLTIEGDYSANTSNAYTSNATSVADAVDKLDAAISAVSATVDSTSASSVSGDSKVVIDVTQEKGKITATAANITGVKLDGYTEGGDAKIAATDTLGVALGKLQGQINGMDLAAVGEAGSVITGVSEADGKVSASATPLTDITLVGFVADSGTTGDVAASDSVEAALNKLQNKIVASQAATTVASSGNSISVSTAITGTNIDVHIKEGEKVLASSVDGLYTDIKLQKITTGLAANLEAQYQLIGTDGTQLGNTTIDIKKDSAIQEIYLGTSGDTIDETSGVITKLDGDKQFLNYAYIKADGTYGIVKIDVSKFLAESEFASGVTATDGIVHGVVDPTSEKDSNNNSFLTVGTDGFKVDGIKSEINAKIAALDVTSDAAVAGQYVAAIEETDGIVAVKTRANVSEAVLNNYAKGSDASAITASDTVNQALSKLENQVDAAKAAATTEVIEGTDTGNNLSISSGTAADGHTTYTINLADVASASALTAETAAREAADTELSNRLGTGVTTDNTATAQLAALSGTTEDPSSATSIAGAKKYTDEKVEALSGKSITAITSANNSISATSSTTSGSVTYDLVTDASKIQMSGFSADTSGFTAISESSSVTEAFKAVESYVLETEEVTAAALTDLDARIKAISGDSSSNLNAEIAARKAVDGQTGDTYAANTSTNYISAATSLNDADVKLDTAIKGAQDEIDAIETAVGLNANGTFIAPSGSVVSGANSVKEALEKLDAALKDTNLTAGSGITITNNAGNEDEISVKLASSHTVNNQTVENPLKFDNANGLYFDTLDCGTY